MKFIIITPTYKRPDNLLAAVQSVMDQSYGDWRMIIVNDSPADIPYGQAEEKIKNDKRIAYIKNIENRGANFARNQALDIAARDTTDDDWIVFLDDDDTLAKNALQTLVETHATYPKEKWIVTNRASYDGTSFTKAPQNDRHYSYAWGYLITKQFKGDATHCIHLAEIKNIRFPKTVRQGEEWLFYYELSLSIKKFFYRNSNTTFSFGYAPEGLNFRKRSKKERFAALCSLIRESAERGMLLHPTLWLYLTARILLLPFQ